MPQQRLIFKNLGGLTGDLAFIQSTQHPKDFEVQIQTPPSKMEQLNWVRELHQEGIVVNFGGDKHPNPANGFTTAWINLEESSAGLKVMGISPV